LGNRFRGLAGLQPQPLDGSLGSLVLHEQSPHESGAGVLDTQ
jgi:hypothetical protein